jgi:hypothetical protein
MGAIILILVAIFSGKIIENNKAGYCQVKQAFITGKMSTRMTPGWYLQLNGQIFTYKQVATVGFGDEKGEGSADIDAVPVIFNDGSKAKISGLVRIKLPATHEGLLDLKNEYAGGYEHFIRSGVVPVVKNSIKLSANLRSAQDAYTTLALFQQAVEDQLRNGIYKTRSDVRVIVRSTGEKEKIRLTEIVMDSATGDPVRETHRLQELGCELTECVVHIPAFDSLVETMIAKRKEEAMLTELAKQQAIRAQQEKITAEEKGKAAVMTVQYEKEQVKIAAVVEARKDKEVAELNAQKELEVAKLQRSAAVEQKQREILLGQGEATRKRLVMQADGALKQKLDTWLEGQKIAWTNIGKSNVNWVPQIIMGGGAGGGKTHPYANGASYLMDILAVNQAQQLGLNMGVKKGNQ